MSCTAKCLVQQCNLVQCITPRVLSIQSHVVSGYAGNRSATFPLQVLGFEVDVINSVQFSNHTGYKSFKGQVLSDKDLSELMQGLEDNNLDFFSHLLTGYVGSASFLNQIANVIRHVKKINPKLIYVCDPVMGDNGQMYVPEELLPIYMETIVPMADILTPNQFEVELLTGEKITCLEDAWKAIDIFHKKGVKTVVLSSTELSKGDTLMALASHIVDGKAKKTVIHFPKFNASFVGTGDLFAALFLAWMYKSNNDLKKSLENTIASLQKVLVRTMAYAEKHLDKKPACYELKLVQSKKDIENPEVTINAELLQ